MGEKMVVGYYNENGIFNKFLKDELRSASKIFLIIRTIDTYAVKQLHKAIRKNKKLKIRIIVSDDSGRTSFRALMQLMQLERKYNIKVFLVQSTSVWVQSNVMMLKSDNKKVTCSGAFTFTKKSLNSQYLTYTISVKKKHYRSGKKVYKKLKNHKGVNRLHVLLLKKYEYKYDKLRVLYSTIKSENTSLELEHWIFDIPFLKQVFADWKSEQLEVDIFDSKHENYRVALSLMKKLVDNHSISEKQFQTILDALIGTTGVRGLWDSQGMQSHKPNIISQYKEFQQLVKEAIEMKDASLEDVYDLVKGLSEEIKGIGVSILNEILFTIDAQKFVKIKSQLLNILATQAGIRIPITSFSIDGEEYGVYALMLRDLSQLIGIKDGLQFDLFLDYLIEEGNEQFTQYETGH